MHFSRAHMAHTTVVAAAFAFYRRPHDESVKSHQIEHRL